MKRFNFAMVSVIRHGGRNRPSRNPRMTKILIETALVRVAVGIAMHPVLTFVRNAPKARALFHLPGRGSENPLLAHSPSPTQSP